MDVRLFVIVGSIVRFAIGATWYGPLFGRRWAKAITFFRGEKYIDSKEGHGKSKWMDEANKKKPLWVNLLLELFASFIYSRAFHYLISTALPIINHDSNQYHVLDVIKIALAAQVFLFGDLFSHLLWQDPPVILFVLDVGKGTVVAIALSFVYSYMAGIPFTLTY